MKETPMKIVVFNFNRALASVRQTERPSTHHISEAKLVRMCLQLCGYRHRDYSAHRVCWNYAQSVFDVVAFENVYSPKTECGCPSGGGIKNGRIACQKLDYVTRPIFRSSGTLETRSRHIIS